MDVKKWLVPYHAPQWARENLKFIPKWRVKLACVPSPIHEWKLDGIPDDYSISIKRDDLTGSILTGNKVRKLEFLLAEALAQDCSCVITCGYLQSNHGRATAIAAKQLGLHTHLLLRSKTEDLDEIKYCGNLLLDKMVDAHIHIVPFDTLILPTGPEDENALLPRMEKISTKIKEETGEKSCIIPVGGSSLVGMFGYIDAFQELLEQGVGDDFDDLVLAIGSGGTAAGIAIANYLTGSKIRIHAAMVAANMDYLHSHINEMLAELEIDAKSEDIINIIDSIGLGYGLSTPEELDFIIDTSSKTGIILDPVYTGKAAKCMIDHLKQNPDIFQGKRILFLHTGGLFGLFDGRMDSALKGFKLNTNKVHVWSDGKTSPSIV